MTDDSVVPLLEIVKVTLPVGMPIPGATAATVAVKVTGPAPDGLAEETTVVFVAAWLTVWVSGVAVVLAVKLPSPEYVAVIECGPPRGSR